MANLIFPYQTLGSELQCSIKNPSLVSISGQRTSRKPIELDTNSEVNVINLSHPADPNWQALRFDVLIAGSREELEPLFQAHGELHCVVTANCRLSKLRQSVVLQRADTNRYAWKGTVEVNRCDVFGLIKINGFLSGHTAGRDHRYLAHTNEWVIYLDEAYMPQISGSLKVMWINFKSDQTYGDMRRFATEPYYVNLEPPIPELYLNKGFTGLPEILSDEIKVGVRRAVQETLRTGIAKSTWLALFQASMEGIGEEDQDDEPRLPESEWQVSVLRQILPKIYPGLTLEAALRAAVEERKSQGSGRIESQAVSVIGRDIVREGKAVRTAVSELDLEFGGEE